MRRSPRSPLPVLVAGTLLPVLTVPLVAESVPAFPGAEGAGALATGGRGGSVYRVTNLHADGPGSLADAVSQPNRVVVFDVSGIIDLTAGKEGKPKGGKLEITQPNITIAGQTAPGEGICLKGGALEISASNVIVRYLRSRRGFVRDTDTGDAIEVKPATKGVQTEAAGQTSEAFDKRKAKKAERGKFMHAFESLNNIVIDHCSASWATDENLTVTHSDRTTVSYCIAAEGLDYTNSKQTPPNHSEGSLWGSETPDGRATMHHVLYANNRLRNPRMTGGADVPAVLTLFNNVVANWSEYATHTGSERIHVNWLGNYYQPGPDTPAEIRGSAFGFHGDAEARVYPSGNVIQGSEASTQDNRRAVDYARKVQKLSPEQRAAMIVDAPFGELPPHVQSATDGYETVLAEAGATLPARDATDLRIVRGVRDGTGRIIQKETDLPDDQRWPDYRSLPALADSDHDGIPDYWEKQFGLNPNDPTDSVKLSAGYANIEHYFNNTDPTGSATPLVYVSATVSRALAQTGQAGEWRVTRTGSTTAPLQVAYAIAGDGVSGTDFQALSGSITIPAGQQSAVISVPALPNASDNRTITIALATGHAEYHVGCPSQSLIVIRK
jgi:pectate lyase